jgi:hypothetical protein
MICFDCKAEFEPTGKGGRCISCRRIWDRAWRARRKAEGRPVIPNQMSREWHQEYDAEYRKRPDIRERLNERARIRAKSQIERPKIAARRKLRHEVESGRIQQQPCQVCGNLKSQAHHADYCKPLDVEWLCTVHHAAEHAKAEGST